MNTMHVKIILTNLIETITHWFTRKDTNKTKKAKKN